MFNHMCNSASYAVAFSGISFRLPFRLALSTTLCQLKAILLYSKLNLIKKFKNFSNFSRAPSGPSICFFAILAK